MSNILRIYPLQHKLRSAVRLPFMWLIGIILLVSGSPLSGQSAAGVVEGRVFNALINSYVNRAVVVVDDTGQRVFTNNFGEYRLTGVPAGTQRVRVQFTGMEDVVSFVTVEAGAVVRQDVTLVQRRGRSGDEQAAAVFELDEFIVSASDNFRSYADIAVQEERFSPNLRTVVAADAYGTIAQGNIGEFIKFVPGVAIDYGGEYSSGADATQISIRGFRPDQTSITVDGVPISSAQPGSLTRGVSLDMLSINNASRVEVIKVPTPDQPLAAIGGSVNLISKSAFEYAKPSYSFRVYVGMNSEHLDFWKKTPGPMHERSYKAIPGFDFSYALPLNDKLGFTFNVAIANQFNSNIEFNPQWETWREVIIPKVVMVDGTVLEDVYPDASRPLLNNIKLTDSPRISERTSTSVKMDYSPFTGHLISASYAYSKFSASDAGRRMEVGTGGSGSIQEYGPDYAVSKDGTGKAEINLTALDREGETHSGYLKWTFIKGPWNIAAIGSASTSTGELVSVRNGHFSGLDLGMGGVHKAILSGLVDGVPANVEFYDEDGNELDPGKLDSYRVSGYDPTDPAASRLQLVAGDSVTRSENYAGKFDIKRTLDFLPFESMQFSVKAGVYWQDRRESKWGNGTGYRYQYMGESGVLLNLADFKDDYYVGVNPGFGFAPREWPDTSKLYRYFLDNPQAFSNTNDRAIYALDGNGRTTVVQDAVAATNWSSFFNQQKSISERSLSHYLQLEGNFFDHRLLVVGGYRQESSKRTGQAPFTDQDGSVLRDPNVVVDGRLGVMTYPGFGSISILDPIAKTIALEMEAMGAVYPDGSPFIVADLDEWRPLSPTGRPLAPVVGRRVDGFDHGPVLRGTLQERQFRQIPNYEVSERSKGRAAPMLSAAYDVTDSIVLRAAWSQTYAPPAYEGTYGILRSVTFTQPRVDQIGNITPGRINVGNPSLRPWQSENWDYGISYYTQSGGKFSFNYFVKNITDMHQTILLSHGEDGYDQLLAELGFGPSSIYFQQRWDIATVRNVPDGGKQYGWEIDMQQDMSILGKWGEYFYVFASYSTKKRTVAETLQSADAQFGNNAPDNFAAGGVNFNFRRFSSRINVTWRNEQVTSRGNLVLLTDPRVKRNTDDPSTFTPVPYQVTRPAEFRIDLNLGYRLTDRYSIDFAARNITDTGRVSYLRSLDGTYPEYAVKGQRSVYGVNFTIGVRGEF